MVRMILKSFLLGGSLLPLTLALPRHDIQNLKKGYGPSGSTAAERAQAVIDVFRFSWEGYYNYAFPNDELRPVSNSWGNSRNGWGASAIDALSTALVMRQKDIVNQVLDFVPTINFSKTDSEVSLFETTIRYLGGLVSGYDFLTGPLADLADDKSKIPPLLTQAIHLANNLSYAFETPSGVPYNGLDFSKRGVDGSPNGLATTGTLILEWVRLADLSGNKTYATLVEKAESYLLHPQPASSEPWPGLVGTNINVTTGQFLDARGGWTGGTDSFYEYLIKMWIYDPIRYSEYKDRWIAAADSTMKYLTSHPLSRPDLTFVAMYNGQQLRLRSQHLACFDGGNFILAGQVLQNQTYIDYGLALVNGCHETYTATVTGIGPEGFGWDPAAVPSSQREFYNKSGFYITDASYNLRPEVLESFYYAYRATGDTKYQDWVWDAFQRINATTRTGSGHSSVPDVMDPTGGAKGDMMESFWFAEVLKYAFLIFAEEEEWQVGGVGDGWVYNTEAHPFRIAGSKIGVD